MFVDKCEKAVKIGKAVSTTCRMIGAIAQTGMNIINFDKAFQSVTKEYKETGHMSFLNGANAALSALGVIGGIAQSVSSIQNLNKMRSSLSSKSGSNIGAFDYYMDLVETLDVSTAPNTATFYSGSGNRALAEEFARTNGKMTLETTPGGAYLDNLKLFDVNSPLTKEEATNVWARLSARYAQNASEIHMVLLMVHGLGAYLIQ